MSDYFESVWQAIEALREAADGWPHPNKYDVAIDLIVERLKRLAQLREERDEAIADAAKWKRERDMLLEQVTQFTGNA